MGTACSCPLLSAVGLCWDTIYVSETSQTGFCSELFTSRSAQLLSSTLCRAVRSDSASDHLACGVHRRAAPQPPQQPSASAACVMLLCRVTLGRVGPGGAGLRRCPDGLETVTSGGPVAAANRGRRSSLSAAWQAGSHSNGEIYAVFDNAQGYPEYLVHYNQ